MTLLEEAEPETFGPNGPDIGRHYAELVVKTALEAAVENEDYFRHLEPHLLMELLRGVGLIEERIAIIGEDIKALVSAQETTANAIQQIIQRFAESASEDSLTRGSDQDVKVEFLANERGEVMVFHDRPFIKDLRYIVYEPLASSLDVVMYSEDIRTYGLATNFSLSGFAERNQSRLALVVQIDVATGEPVVGAMVPFFVMPTNE